MQRDLAAENHRLAVIVAVDTFRKLRRPGYNRDDALSVASEALCRAAIAYHSDVENFRAYLAQAIRRAVRQEARRWGRDVQGVPPGTPAPPAAALDLDGDASRTPPPRTRNRRTAA